MNKVTSIGGIFFKCKNPESQKSWYQQHLGINSGPYGFDFEWRPLNDPSKIGKTVWSPFKQDTNYLGSADQQFMINYRVENLEALLVTLQQEGVTILDEIEDSDYGKFLHILDGEGNRVELWEPKDSTD